LRSRARTRSDARENQDIRSVAGVPIKDGRIIMKKSALLGCAAVLIAGTAMAAPLPAFLVYKPAHIFITAATPGSRTLHDQNKDPSGALVVSESDPGIGEDSQAADDFVVPVGHNWTINEVDVTGVFVDGAGPAISENVFFYKNKGGIPGNLVVACLSLNGTDNGFGSFAIALPKGCKAKLHGGATYWVSVQANMDFSGGGEWGWSLSTDTSGNPAGYRDNGSCATWCSLPSDLMFALKGKDKH
jgi:hypothetical protein